MGSVSAVVKGIGRVFFPDTMTQKQIAESLAAKGDELLDMSNKARMSRAKAQGYGETMFHGTDAGDIEEFTNRVNKSGKEVPVFASPTPALANRFADGGGITEGANILEVRANVKNTFDFRNPEHTHAIKHFVSGSEMDKIKNGEWRAIESDETIEAIKGLGFDSFRVMEGSRSKAFAEADRAKSKLFPNTEQGKIDGRLFFSEKINEWKEMSGKNALKPKINSSGKGFTVDFQGDEFKNIGERAEGSAGVNTAIFDPSNIRSVNAAFDPLRSKSADLLASVAPVAVGLGALSQSDESEASFLGTAAKHADKMMLDIAQKMERAGITPDEIWKKTGWGKGADSKWRFEISDENLNTTIKARRDQVKGLEDNLFKTMKEKGIDSPEFKEAREVTQGLVEQINAPIRNEVNKPLSSMITHPELFDNYPDMKSISTRFDVNSSDVGSAAYRPDLDAITVQGNPDYIRSGVGHEAQHAIQGREGFAKGGNPNVINDRKVEELRNKIEAEYSKSDWNPDVVQKLIAEKKKAIEDIEIGPVEAYRRLAGETEARNVQTRIDMNPSERRAKAPWLTEDVPRSQQIVRYSVPAAAAGFGALTQSNESQAQRLLSGPGDLSPKMIPLTHGPKEPFPNLQKGADFLDKWTETPIGPAFEGISEYLRGFGRDMDAKQRAKAAIMATLDVI